VVALGRKFGEEVSVHGEVDTSWTAERLPASNHYARRMDNQQTVEVRDTETAEPIGEAVIDEELLIEEISIDGMCGVY
jgi:mycofactocin precursor